MNKLKILLLLSAILATGCSNYKQLKDNQEPNLNLAAPIPNNWSNDIDLNSTYEVAMKGWVREFNNAKITLIAQTVIANNQDLKIAANNVKAAEASARKAGADLNPTANLKLDNQTKGNFDQSDTTNSVGASIDISWEADIWGKLSASEASATSDFQASKEDYIAARESLIAQAVKAYLLAIEAYQQKQISLDAKDSYEKDLEITQAFFEAGSKTEQDVSISKANLAAAEDNLAQSENGYKESLRSLELLLGQYPSGEYAIEDSFPFEPQIISAGVPSDILENRPDIRSAERQVASAFNATTMAKAAKLPSIALTSNIGGSSDDLNNLADPTNLFWNLAGNLLTPLFDSGALQDNVEIADSNQKAAIAAYQSAALNAFNDVETALSNENTTRKRIKLLEINYNQSELAYNFENSKYLQGIGNIMDVNQLNRNMILAKSDLVKAERDLLSARVNLYLALGIPAFTQELEID